MSHSSRQHREGPANIMWQVSSDMSFPYIKTWNVHHHVIMKETIVRSKGVKPNFFSLLLRNASHPRGNHLSRDRAFARHQRGSGARTGYADRKARIGMPGGRRRIQFYLCRAEEEAKKDLKEALYITAFPKRCESVSVVLVHLVWHYVKCTWCSNSSPTLLWSTVANQIWRFFTEKSTGWVIMPSTPLVVLYLSWRK